MRFQTRYQWLNTLLKISPSYRYRYEFLCGMIKKYRIYCEQLQKLQLNKASLLKLFSRRKLRSTLQNQVEQLGRAIQQWVFRAKHQFTQLMLLQ